MSKNIEIAYLKCDSLQQNSLNDYENADVVLVLAKNFSSLCIKDELSGKSDKLIKLGRITKNVKGLTFVSLMSDNYGIMHQSVAVFLSGKLIKLADLNKSYSRAIMPSFGVKMATYNQVKYGIAVGKDVADFNTLSTLNLCENDVIINLSADFYDFSCEKLISTLSYLFGTTILSLNTDKMVVATLGQILLDSDKPQGKLKIQLNKNYREIITKGRGLI